MPELFYNSILVSHIFINLDSKYREIMLGTPLNENTCPSGLYQITNGPICLLRWDTQFDRATSPLRRLFHNLRNKPQIPPYLPQEKLCHWSPCFSTKPRHLLSHLGLKTQHRVHLKFLGTWILFRIWEKVWVLCPRKMPEYPTETILDWILGKSQGLWLNRGCFGSSSSFYLHLHSSHLTFLPHLSISLSLFIHRNYWNRTGSLPA